MPYGKIFDTFNCWLPRVHFEADFHAPARLDERLRVTASVKALGTTSITLHFDIDNQAGTRLAEFEIVLVCTDRTTSVKRNLPDELRWALSRFA